MPFYRKSDPLHGLCTEGLKFGLSFAWINLSLDGLMFGSRYEQGDEAGVFDGTAYAPALS